MNNKEKEWQKAELRKAYEQHQKIQERFSIQTSLFLGGGLFLLTQLIDKINDLTNKECLLLFYMAALCFSLGLILSLISWLLSVKASNQYINYIKIKEYGKEPTLNKFIRCLDGIVFLAAIIGSISLLVFVWQNNFFI